MNFTFPEEEMKCKYGVPAVIILKGIFSSLQYLERDDRGKGKWILM